MAMRRTSLEERVAIEALAGAGFSDRRVAERVGWSLPTVRRWRRRGQRAGAGRAPRLGRPPTGALSGAPADVRERLRDWRAAHPRWGPKTLRAELEAEPDLA